MFHYKKTNWRSRFSNQSGLTLIEIIVVIVIIGVLSTFLVGNLFNKADQAKAELNRNKMKQLKLSIDRFRMQYNSLPSSLEELTGCSDKTGQGCIPIATADDVQDLFGQKFRYTLLDNGRRYRVTSLGADQKDGGTGADYDVFIEGP
jgi:general secretion pathway protein G